VEIDRNNASESAGTILFLQHCPRDNSQTEEHAMIKRLAVAAVAVIGIYSAVPASAEEVGVGVGVGPVGAGVTVGTGRPDYDRDRVREREVIREREPRRDETVIIKKEHDRDWDRGERKVIIDR